MSSQALGRVPCLRGPPTWSVEFGGPHHAVLDSRRGWTARSRRDNAHMCVLPRPVDRVAFDSNPVTRAVAVSGACSYSRRVKRRPSARRDCLELVRRLPLCSLRSTMPWSTPRADRRTTPDWKPPPASSWRSSFPTSRTCEGAYAVAMSERLFRVPEVARTLGVEGTEVYRLIERGELAAGKGSDGLVYVTADAPQTYRTDRRKLRARRRCRFAIGGTSESSSPHALPSARGDASDISGTRWTAERDSKHSLGDRLQADHGRSVRVGYRFVALSSEQSGAAPARLAREAPCARQDR